MGEKKFKQLIVKALSFLAPVPIKKKSKCVQLPTMGCIAAISF